MPEYPAPENLRWHWVCCMRKAPGHGATVIVIEHDLDVIRNADYIIDMGPGGGEEGGQVVAVGMPEQIAENANSVTGKYIRI